MYKKFLFFGIIGLSTATFAQKNISSDDMQSTAKNVAIQLQIPPAERNNFTSEYTNKTMAIQEIMNQNISAQEKANKAKALLNQSKQNLKQSTPTTQLSRYDNYFNKNATLTASVTNTKPATKQNNTSTSTNTTSTNNIVYTKNKDYNTLPKDHQEVMDNMGLQLSLDNNQFQKMSSEYLAFFNGTEDIKKNYSNNILKAKTEFDALVTKTNNNVKSFLSNEQYNQFSTLLKSGKLGKDTTPRVNAGSTNNTVSQPSTTVNKNVNLSEISSAKTLTELKKSLALTEAQYTKSLAIANKYDAEIKAVSAQFPNNIDQQKAALDKKTPSYVSQFKAAMNLNQANTYFGVLIVQFNILTGKNLTPEQQQLIQTMRAQYGLSDVQIIQSMLIISEAKVKADANKNLNKNNPTLQKQESDKIIADIDAKLKNVLTTEQYNKVKADIMNAVNKK